MSKLFRESSEVGGSAHSDGDLSPGKSTLTQRHGGGRSMQVILRVDSAEAARELAGLFGRRDDNGVASDADEHVDRAATSSGQPLPGDLRDRFETSLDADLSDVRVHTGGDSAMAAGAVGAKAYTVGNDIHFGEGQFDPGSADGMHLIAHEVAHTVQQHGQPARRQNKLEVSTPGDPNELEADVAADAMVAGRSAVVSSGGGVARKIHRDSNGADDKDKDKAWATEIRDKVQEVQDAASKATDILNEDADTALKAVKQAQQSYNSFEAAYSQALGRFTKGVKKAMEQAEELRGYVKFAANTAITMFGGAAVKEGFELAGKAAGIIEKAGKAAAVIDKFTKPAGPEKPDAKPEVNPGPTTATDWKALLGTAIESYDKYIKGNKAIAGINKSCLEQVKFLNSVIDGKGGDNPRTGDQGTKAEGFKTGSAEAIQILGSFQKGAVSTGATSFATTVSNALDKQTSEKIEQDIAIKWMGGLSKSQLSALDDADSYLKQLGVIDTKGNRLGVDTGKYTTEWDTMVMQARAQVETRAQAMLGTVRGWGGGRKVGEMVHGSVHGDETSSNWWPAVGPGDLPEGMEGQVLVLSYSIAPIDKDVASNWEHVHEHELQGRMISKVTFSVSKV
jgi:hypothetical protein